MQIDHIKRIAITGVGLMGHGIGQEFALAGYQVVLHDLVEEKIQAAVRRIEGNLARLAEWGIISADEIEPSLSRIAVTAHLEEAAAEADLVVEAVYEDLDLKQQVFRDLDRFCPPRTILASNTSSFLPSLLAAATGRSDRVLVAHYFYPASLLPVVEVVRSPLTSEETVETVCAVLQSAGKRPVVVQKECFGFIANRLQFALQREALAIVEEGIAAPEDVDVAVRDGFGRRLAFAGPLEIAEPVGWDLELRIQKALFPHLSSAVEPSPLVVNQVAKGQLGCKTGKGFYEWSPEAVQAWQDRMAEALARLALEQGMTQK